MKAKQSLLLEGNILESSPAVRVCHLKISSEATVQLQVQGVHFFHCSSRLSGPLSAGAIVCVR